MKPLSSDQKTPGQVAYEEDVRRHPYYCRAYPRMPWGLLTRVQKETWEKNPTPREWRKQ